MYYDEVHYMSYQSPSEKWCRFENIWPSHAKRFVCCALTIQYIIYNMVGRSIASISDLGSIFTLVLPASVNVAPQLYLSYGPPYSTLHITYHSLIS